MRVDKSLRNLLIVHMHVEERRTLTEIGDSVGLTRERVRQIMRAAGVAVSVTSSIRTERDHHVYVDLTCEHCGRTVKKVESKIGAGRFCSRRCTNLHRGYSDDELLSQIRRMALILDRTPALRDFGNPWPNHQAYIRRFGSLRAAQELAGLLPNTQGGPLSTRQRPLPAGFRDEWEHLLEAVVV